MDAVQNKGERFIWSKLGYQITCKPNLTICCFVQQSLFHWLVSVLFVCFFFSDEVAAYELKQKEAEAKKERLWVSFAFSQKNKILLCRFLIVCYQQPQYVIAIGNIMLDGRMDQMDRNLVAWQTLSRTQLWVLALRLLGPIGQLRVGSSLCFKARLNAKLLIWKYFSFVTRAIKTFLHKKGFALGLDLKVRIFWNSEISYYGRKIKWICDSYF